MLGSLAMAANYDYEITPVVGYNIAEGNIEIDNQKLVGAEAQFNNVNSILKPELSVLYTNADYDIPGAVDVLSTNIYRIALNGVYEYQKMGFLTPLAKIGMGYETMNAKYSDNKDSMFGDIGVGAKVPFTDSIALKLEAVYMIKDNSNRWDNNVALLAGLNFAFGEKAQAAPAPVAAPIVAAPVVVAPVVTPKPVDGDDDHDGVKNSIDKCPNTPAGAKVDADGCPVLVNLHINFPSDSHVVSKESYGHAQTFADFLKMYPNYKAKIVGHTDSTATTAYNQKLSEKRAAAVKVLLVKDGAKATQITTSGMGETKPIADNKTAAGRAENRRIEAELTKN